MDQSPLEGALTALADVLRGFADWAEDLPSDSIDADAAHAAAGQVLAANLAPAIAQARALLDLPRTPG